MNVASLTTSEIKVLLAVISVSQQRPRITVRDVAQLAGFSLAHTHSILSTLRRSGVVTWEDNKTGTLRPLLEVAT